MGGPMQTTQAQPDLTGLLDESFTSMLEEMLAADPQSSMLQLPSYSDPVLLQDLAPAQEHMPGFAQQQAPQAWNPPAQDQHEEWSFEKKRSGSGEEVEGHDGRSSTLVIHLWDQQGV